MTEENLETMPLAELGEQITRRAGAADDHILKAAEMICVARRRFEMELAGQTTWTEWARQNIKLSESRRRDLLRVADADDPRQELERIKEMTRKRAKKHRENQKAKQAAASEGSSDKSVKKAANPELGQQVPSEAGSEPEDGRLEEQKEVPSLRNDGEVAGAMTPEESDLRRLLIRWAETAPPEKIENVWTYVQGLEPAASGSDAEGVSAAAAA